MRKSAFILGFGIVASLAAKSMAQDSSLWFDVRDNSTITGAAGISGQAITATVGAPSTPYTLGQNPVGGSGNSADRFGTAVINGGGRGAGGVLRLNPTQASGVNAIANPNGSASAWPNYPVAPAVTGDNNSATGSLYLYMDVNDDASGVGDVISSLGIDINLSNGPLVTTARNPVGSVAFTMFNDASVAKFAGTGGSPSTPWNGVANGASNLGTPPSIIGAKAVRVPVTSGPAYAASLGCQANASGGTYRVGRLDVTAGTRNCVGRTANNHVDNSTYSVKLSVNNLLITRVFSSGGDGTESVNMGYDPYVADGANFGVLDAGISGSVVGTSAFPDAAIQIRLHGDFNADGNVTNADVAGFTSALNANSSGTLTVAQCYLADFNGSKSVTNADVAGFTTALTVSGNAACP